MLSENKIEEQVNSLSNELAEAFADGAEMAYEDCARLVEELIANAPEDLKDWASALQPIAEAYRLKASTVHSEVEQILQAERH